MTGPQPSPGRRAYPVARSAGGTSHRSLIGSPVVAAALSFVFPGLGQAAAGKPRRGAIVAIPALALLAAFGLILLFDRHSLFGLALNQGWLTSLLILDLAGFIYHLWAILDSYLLAGKAQPAQRRVSASARKWAPIFGICVILAGAIGVHAGVAEVDMSWQHDLYCLTAATPCWVTDINSRPVRYRLTVTTKTCPTQSIPAARALRPPWRRPLH